MDFSTPGRAVLALANLVLRSIEEGSREELRRQVSHTLFTILYVLLYLIVHLVLSHSIFDVRFREHLLIMHDWISLFLYAGISLQTVLPVWQTVLRKLGLRRWPPND